MNVMDYDGHDGKTPFKGENQETKVIESDLDGEDLRAISQAFERSKSGAPPVPQGTVKIHNAAAFRAHLLKKFQEKEVGAASKGERNGSWGGEEEFKHREHRGHREHGEEQKDQKVQESEIPISEILEVTPSSDFDPGKTVRITGLGDIRADLRNEIIAERMSCSGIDVRNLTDEELPEFTAKCVDELNEALFQKNLSAEERLVKMKELTPTLSTATFDELRSLGGVFEQNGISESRLVLEAIHTMVAAILFLLPIIIVVSIKLGI